MTWECIQKIDWISQDPGYENKIESRYTITGLQENTCYYLKVVAVNEKGEGYSPKEPFFCQTMAQKILACESLYVWGYNGRNELGLSDDQISANKSDYLKAAMTKPLKN